MFSKGININISETDNNAVLSKIRYLRPKNIREYRTYTKWYNFINESQWWSKDRLLEYQWEKLVNLLQHSYKNVPYYQSLFKDIGATPEDIISLEDFKGIPVLTKEIIRNRFNEFFPKNLNKRNTNYFTTSGSTGEPFGFYKEKVNDIIERAFMYNQWARVGFEESCSRVILRGEMVENDRLFFKRRFSNNWIFSSYHLTNKYIGQYVEKLNEIKPQFFHVYPSSLNILTHLILENKLELKFQPKAILCGSEILYEYQRKLFEKTYNSRVYSWLGLAEQTTLAGECEYSNCLHIWPQHSYVELLNEDCQRVDQIGETGEIIGTNLHNYATPFIRYKSGDKAVYDGDECNKCGRDFILLGGVKGRIQDVVYLKDGSTFPIGPAIFGIHEDYWSNIRNIQIVQEELGLITFKVDVVNKDIIQKIDKLFTKRFSNIIDYKIVQSQNFLRTKNGKNMFLVHKIKTND